MVSIGGGVCSSPVDEVRGGGIGAGADAGVPGDRGRGAAGGVGVGAVKVRWYGREPVPRWTWPESVPLARLVLRLAAPWRGRRLSDEELECMRAVLQSGEPMRWGR